MGFGLDFERLPIARPLAIFDMAPTAGNETFRSSCAPNHRASQRGPDRDAPPMTRVAAVKAAVGSDDRKTYAEMLKTTQRRRRVDKAKVHRALALLARDLGLFVGSFNARLKAVAQLTFHDAPDDLRVASIGRGEIKKKRSRRAGARVQRGRRNEAKRGRGVEASPNPIFQATEEGSPDKPQDAGWREPPRQVSSVAWHQKQQQPKDAQKKTAERTGRITLKEEKRPALEVQGGAVDSAPMGLPILVVQEGAVGTSPSEVPALTSDSRAVGAVTVGTVVLWKKEEAVAFVATQEKAKARKAAPLQQEEQTPPFSEDSTATYIRESMGQLKHGIEQAGQRQFQQQFQQQIQQQYQQPFQQQPQPPFQQPYQQQYQQPFQQQPQQPFQQPYQQQFQQQFQQPFQPFQQQQFGGQFQQYIVLRRKRIVKL